MEHLGNWKVKTWTLPGKKKKHFSSEIYADVGDEVAQVAYIPLVLTDSDHKLLRDIEEGNRKRRDESLAKSGFKFWNPSTWGRITPSQERNWHKDLQREIQAREDVYKKRKSKEYHDSHLHLILATPSMYKLLKAYAETQEIDRTKLKAVLDIAEGRFTPLVTNGEED